MKTKQLLMALVLCLSLAVPAAPVSLAMPERASGELATLSLKDYARPLAAVEPASPALEAPVQGPAAGPTPTPGAPSPLAEEPMDHTAVPQEIAGVPGATEDWWAAVQEQIRGDLYSLAAEEADGGSPAYRGYNPDHGFDLTFAAGGVRLARIATDSEGEPSAEGEPAWTWALRTTGYGYEGDVRPLPALTETASEANRLEYRRADLAEWYVNDERGLEQGFTLASPPAGEGDVLVLEMALDTELVPLLSGGAEGDPDGSGQAIEFTQPGGNVVVLRYSDLYAYDAAGQEPAAHLELAGCGLGGRAGRCTLRLVVEAGGAAYPLSIDPLIAVPSWTALGENPGDNLGFSVARAGDVNGDGYDDVIVGAPGYASWQGKVYVYYGSVDGLGTSEPWTAIGRYMYTHFGASVAAAGDVNGDGYADVIVGEPYCDEAGFTNQGKVYVYMGSPSGLVAGSPWTHIGEANSDYYGHSVASAGDVNRDDFDDIIVSAPMRSSQQGKVYVYYGSSDGLGESDRAPDWTASGVTTPAHFGWSVATAGDVNNDGYADVIIGSSAWENWQGAAYVYVGSDTGLGTTPIFTAKGKTLDHLGTSVASAGDVNGDGYADVIVGAPRAGGDQKPGAAYIYHGSAGGMGTIGGDPDWTARGEKGDDRFGMSVASAGDLNGDGFADVVVGAWGTSAALHQGQAYVYHGSSAGVAATPAWTATTNCVEIDFACSAATAGDVNGDGYADLIVGERVHWGRGRASVYHGTPWGLNPPSDWAAGGEQADDQFGYAVSTAGDVNGDGFSDLLVGAWGYDGGRGRAYLFPGTPAGLSGVPAWTATGEQAGDRFASSVAAAGDVNGDGYDDVAVGAAQNDEAGTNAGKAYLFYGSAAGPAAEPGWTAAGANRADRFGVRVAAAGDVNGDGKADLAVGADGYPQGVGYGKVYVYHGSAAGLASSPAWAASGAQPGARFGWAVGTAGDVNGDGCADLVAGAWAANGYAGTAYVYRGSAAGLGAAPAWSQGGEASANYYGYSVATAGDVNGDGYADVVVGGYGFDNDRGRVYVYHGSAAGLGATADWTATGENAGDELGYAVATAGDVNGDGYADLIAGAEGYDAGSGLVDLYYGGSGGLLGEAAWTTRGAGPGDHLGAAVGTAGDVNGDGLSDLVVGAWGADDPAHGNAGRVYVYHWAAQGLGASGRPADWTAAGENTWDSFGTSVGAAGDVNGDGFADLVVGAPHYDADGFNDRGKVYVYYDSAGGLGDSNWEPDWSATGENAEDYLGYSVATAGDVNGDGYADVIVGAPYYDEGGLMDRGKVYVYYGSAGGLGDSNREPDWSAMGENAEDYLGYSVATAGDVNGDGYADVIVGAAHYDEWQGKVYVYHGSASGLEATAAWAREGEAQDHVFGASVAAAGDVNGDGYADVIVGAPYCDVGGTDRGKAYVYEGSASGLVVEELWTQVGESDWDHYGHSVASAGDVNGDGYADVIVGAPYYDEGGLIDRGKVSVYHGSALGLDVPFFVFSGENLGDHFGTSVGSAGDVNGDGYADVAIGAPHYDIPENTSGTDVGRVYVFHGSPAGLIRDDLWTATGAQNDDSLGGAVAPAGDQSGHGYADLIAGAIQHYDGDSAGPGRAHVYQGSDGGARPGAARQVRGDLSGRAVQPWGPSYTAESFGVRLRAVHPLGRGRARLQVQVCPPAVPFEHETCREETSDEWIDVEGASGVELKLTVGGLDEGGLYRWRARALYDSPLYGRGPWRRVTAQAQEGDVRVTRLPADLAVTKAMTPQEPVGAGEAITYTLSFHSNGPARGVVITDLLSSDIAVTGIISSGADIADTGREPCCVWSVQDLEAGQGGVITITGLAEVDRYVNTAVITGTSPDPNPANNSATVQTHVPGILYVDGDATGANNGLSWASAYTDLQDALDEAQPGDQVWVASGVYKPAGGRSASFVLRNGVALHGGFAGTERWLEDRDAAAPPTVLSGDIGTANNPADNVYHVVTSTLGVTGTAVLEGLTISGGNANGTGANGLGGGLYSSGGSLTLLNVTLVDNAADGGGGIYVENGYPLLVNVALIGNEAEEKGGGVYSTGSSPALIDVTFSGNSATWYGGAMYNSSSSLTLTDVTFTGNSAGSGGGLYNTAGSVVTLTNVTLSGNAADSGGGLYNAAGSVVTLTNATLSGNAADSGGGLYNAAGSDVTLTNAILWGNTKLNHIIPDQIANDGVCSIGYSDVQGGCPAGATCNQVINQDPQLWNPQGDDGLAGTPDDDLRLYTTFRHPSPAIDAGDNSALPADTWDLDGDGDTAERLPFDLSGRDRLIGFAAVTQTVDMGAYEATLLDVLAAGEARFQEGQTFRLENLQLLSSDTLAQALQNYANFNDGEWYDAFCGDYAAIDADGYCPAADPPAIRNTLLDAVDLYRVALAWPTEVFTPAHGLPVAAWDAGGRGVVSATTEIANVHLIFGNEFLVDATDYRFSTTGIPYADQIIAQELAELEQAQQQFELIIELIFQAFNDWDVTPYCNGDQFEQVGMASSLMMSTLNEIAARHYMLRDSQAALAVYDRAYTDQYLHLMALADLAAGLGEEYLQNGSWEMLNNLSQMCGRAQAIHDGLDFFGFAPTYAPLQAYDTLLFLMEGYGNAGLLGTARDLEDQARDAQRTFDANASAMATELDNLTVELNSQLFELCGESDDDYQTCEGGLMLQNLDALDAASIREGLALLRAQNLAEQVRIEEERAGQVIHVRLGLGNELRAAELAIGELRRKRTTTTGVWSSEEQAHAGVELGIEGYYQSEFGWKGSTWKPYGEIEWETKAGFKAYVKAAAGFEWSGSRVDTSTTTTDETEYSIAVEEAGKTMKQAIAEANIEGANSAAVVRNLLLQEAEALEEYDIAMAEFNTLADEHNYLVQRRSRLLNRRAQAVNRVANHNSHLLNPAYRIWRDSLTTQSGQALGLAAQFAYLTARAAEYELLTPYPNLGKIFRARTANDIRLFLDGLKVWVQALDLPGQLNRYPYTVSLARDIWGLTDENLLKDYPGLSQAELPQKRFELFQEWLQANRDGDALEIWFTTTLEQQRPGGQYLFSPNIWNNRIAGVGEPLAGNEGVWLNILTRQPGTVDGVEVVLIHGTAQGGAEAYRNVQGQTVYYDPDTAVPVGYVLPAGLAPENTTVVLRPGINGTGGIANGGLVNLSVASTSWTLRIPANSRGNLRYEDIEDIEIVLDTTGRALPGLAAQAEQDALRLQAGLEMEPVDREPVQMEPTRSAATAEPVKLAVTAPILSGEIGGPYSGMVMVTSPVTIALQVLDVELWNAGGTLTGTITADQAALYPASVGLHGVAAGDSFTLTSDVFTNTVAGRTVTQTLALAGHAEEEGELLRGVYTGTIDNLLPERIMVYGKYHASRPGATGSERLVLEAGAWSVQPGASTAITATLYSPSMELITDTRTLTFTADLGTVTPAVAQTVDGQAVVAFQAGTTLGQATVLATTGEITAWVRIQVSDLAPPQADFAASVVSGTLPLTVTFTDLSLNDPNDWTWDFGDGATSKEQHPTHTYVTTGTFAVTLTAGNALDVDTLTRPAYITVLEPQAPEAHFSADPTSGLAPLTVTFTDESAHIPTGWAWAFGDGGSSTEQHPVHVYNAAGSFTVSLTVSNAVGSHTLTLPGYITVLEPQAPEAHFSADPTSGLAPLTVTFTDESAHIPTGWAWDFGDGGSSTEQHPVYTYYAPGTFTVSLTVSNTVGSDTLTVPGYITVIEGERIYLPLVMRNAP